MALVKSILYTLAALGLYGTWGLSALNGTLGRLLTVLHQSSMLPGSDVPLLTRFTGIYWPIDYLIDVLVVFFWQIVDGSKVTSSVFGLYFAGQHVAVITALYVNSYRAGNVGRWCTGQVYCSKQYCYNRLLTWHPEPHFGC